MINEKYLRSILEEGFLTPQDLESNKGKLFNENKIINKIIECLGNDS